MGQSGPDPLRPLRSLPPVGRVEVPAKPTQPLTADELITKLESFRTLSPPLRRSSYDGLGHT
ncbi:MAG TPA: hypothetical protein DCE44_23225 [Verrucomicrobiales bacterium]|nr:hypothetical protein [Verrucomicrobiales bacterium]